MPTPRPPRSLTAAVWWWGAAAVIVAAFAVAAWAGAEFLSRASRTASLSVAIVLSAAALVLGWGTLRLGLGHLAGRLTLATAGVVGGVPAVLARGRLLPIGVVLLVGVALLYLPGTRRFFRDQLRARRAAGRARR